METVIKRNPLSSQKVSYISSINLIRGVASIGVCAFHLSNGNSKYLADDNIIKMLGAYGWVGVTAFFIVSGFLLPYSMSNRNYTFPGSFMNFLLKRITRIEPPYILAVVLVVLLNFVSSLMPFYHGKEFYFDWVNFILHIGYINVFFDLPFFNPVFWTLAIEFQFYIFIAVIFPLIIHSNKVIRISTLIAFASLSFVFTDSRILFHHSALFTIGILIFQYKLNLLKERDFYFLLLIATANVGYQLGDIDLLASMLTIFIILLISFESKITDFFGKISYSLYLTHAPIGGKIINLSMNFFESQLWRGIIVLVAMSIAILFAWLFYLVIEKQALDLSKKIRY